MTIDEAIEHHEWAMLESDGQVAEEHFQYVEWLLELKRHQAAWDLSCENARYHELIEILRRDWHIEASWDGLRKVWYVGLTEDGIRERDERDVKAREAANIEIGELRELVRDLWDAALHPQTFGDGSYLRGKVEKLGIEVEQ